MSKITAFKGLNLQPISDEQKILKYIAGVLDAKGVNRNLFRSNEGEAMESQVLNLLDQSAKADKGSSKALFARGEQRILSNAFRNRGVRPTAGSKDYKSRTGTGEAEKSASTLKGKHMPKP